MKDPEEFVCDEEKSYREWVATNHSFMIDHEECIEVMQKLYMQGFAAGFIHRNKVNAEEQLQK